MQCIDIWGSNESAAQPFIVLGYWEDWHSHFCRFWEIFPCVFSDYGIWGSMSYLPSETIDWYSSLNSRLLCWGTHLLPVERETTLPATASAALSHAHFNPFFSTGSDWSSLACMVWRKLPSEAWLLHFPVQKGMVRSLIEAVMLQYFIIL